MTMDAPLPPPATTRKSSSAAAKTTKKKSKTTSSKKQRGGQFDTKELRSFFNTMEKILPIGFREWEVVLKQHNEQWSAKEREVRGLRQKFNRLNASKLPTGDPNCPWDVKWAKQLKRKIDEKADANLLDDVSEAEDDDEEGDEEVATPLDDDDDDGDEDVPRATTNNNNTSSSSDDMMITPTNLNRSKDNFGRTISAHMSRNKSKRKYSNSNTTCATASVDDTSRSIAEFMQMQLLMEKKKEEREEKRRQTEREEDRRRDDRMMMMMMAMMSGNKQMMEEMMTQSRIAESKNTKFY